MGNAASALVDKEDFPRPSQAKRYTTRLLAELCTAKNN